MGREEKTACGMMRFLVSSSPRLLVSSQPAPVVKDVAPWLPGPRCSLALSLAWPDQLVPAYGPGSCGTVKSFPRGSNSAARHFALHTSHSTVHNPQSTVHSPLSTVQLSTTPLPPPHTPLSPGPCLANHSSPLRVLYQTTTPLITYSCSGPPSRAGNYERRLPIEKRDFSAAGLSRLSL